MLTLAEAETLLAEHLSTGSRARHSVFVGHAMAALAERLEADPNLWRIVGIVHDLDFEETSDDRSRHGVLTGDWLAGRLPQEALSAIAAHDHRTGIFSTTPLAAALKLADALAVICAALGAETPGLLRRADAASAMAGQLAGRPYLVPLLSDMSARLQVPLATLAAIVETAPPAD